ncbi:phosphoribosylglycinamide formyltransferase [Pararhizobium sp. IMCC21322]|uniref:phosphoribosylglycinamide formyltransferase n=1 Tax=Pararhizobium sp. IMCC21322 TaxID=3067903 RepID=UPI00274199D2|nr:phosphoribosylglycinamide formyltransferase [Pararhizobium sp. IMCC21322]
MKQVAILISARGSNMEALCRASRAPDAAYHVCRVISNRPEAEGLNWANTNGFESLAVDHKQFPNKASFEEKLHAELIACGAEYVCLAGFMRLLSAEFVQSWRGRLLNIHPSLLPSFAGLTPQQRALDAGVRLSGCTVHFVSEIMDAGPIIAQTVVPVLKDDTEDTISGRILRAEHQTYWPALSAVCKGQVSWDNGERATVSEQLDTSLHGCLDL